MSIALEEPTVTASMAPAIAEAPIEEKEIEWSGRKWAALGKNANIQGFTHRGLALASVAAKTAAIGLSSLSAKGFDKLTCTFQHASKLFEGTRDLIDYTGFINTLYRASTEGLDYFVARGEKGIEALKTAANSCFVATSLLFPMHYVQSRLNAENILKGDNADAIKVFAKSGYGTTAILKTICGLWIVGTSINLYLAANDFAGKISQGIAEEKEKNANANFSTLASAGWNNISWSDLNKLQLAAVECAFSLTTGGLGLGIGASSTAMNGLALAFKAMAGINGITQLYLGEKISVPTMAVKA